MTTTDLIYLALIAAGLLLDHFAIWPAYQRRAQVHTARARRVLWAGWMTMLWTLTGTGLALWHARERSWTALGFTMPHGWRLWVSLASVVIVIAFYLRTLPKLTHLTADRKDRLRGQLGELAGVAPHSGSELAGFTALSVSAGFCEEFIFRGYLIWVFHPFLGLWGAAALSVVVFALAHAYQGRKGIVGTGLFGIAFTVIVLGTSSLLPAMLLHALIDIGQGAIMWLVVREPPSERGMEVGAEN